MSKILHRAFIWAACIGLSQKALFAAETYSATEGSDLPPVQVIETSQAHSQQSVSAAGPSMVLGGNLSWDLYMPVAKPFFDPFKVNNVDLRLEGRPKLNDRISAFFNLEFNNQDNANLNIREAYGQYAKGSFDLKLGRQILAWGPSDGYNPTDYFGSKNQTLKNPDEELKRLGSEMLVMSYRPGGASPFTLTLANNFSFRPNVLKQESAMSALSWSSTPQNTLNNSQNAAKISFAGMDFDTSISAYRGYNHTPEYMIKNSAIGLDYQSLYGFGWDATYSSEKAVFRFESAYHYMDLSSYAKKALAPPSYVDAVFGVEKPFFDSDMRVQIQGIIKANLDWTDPHLLKGVDALVANANALLHNFQEQIRYGATARISYTFKDFPLDLEAFGFMQFKGADYYLRPKMTYALGDLIKLSLGIDYFGGEKDRPLGSQTDLNSVFLETKLSF